MKMRPLFSKMVTAVILASAMGCAASASAQASLEGVGETTELNCRGGKAEIVGTSNQVQIKGACTLLSIEGTDNIVTIAMAERSAIEVVGTNNRVTWTAPAKSQPRVSSTGVGNRISRAR
ncbi:MAG TPA: DUF3060 domain-containing protein [Sphingopyxis sp.]|nr:DUF3060 domain-containing protein [Sphingopyxis sp.]